MAGEQEIITRFKGDISDLVASVDAGEKKVAKLEEPVVVPVSLDDKKLSASLGSAAQKFAVLDATAKRTGESGQKAGENIAVGMSGAAKSLAEVERLAKSDLDLVKALIAEASKTPQGAAALAKNLNLAQQAALKALVSMGALSKEEAQVAADATKLINAQGKLPGEVVKSVSAYTSLRTQLRQSRDELDRLIEASGGRLTPEIREAAAAAGKLQDRFGDLNATINAFNPDKKFQAITGVIQNVAGGFTALQGVIALTGGDTDKVAQSLLKVQAALAVTQGLQSLFGGLKDNLKIIRLLFTSSAVAAQGLAVAEGEAAAGAAAQGVATGGLTGFLNAAKVAAQRLYATLIANPFVAVAAAIGLVVAGIIAYTSKTEEASETTDQLIARLDRIAQREKFIVDRRAQENILQSERLFLEDKADALKLQTEAERKAALATAEANRKRRDDGIEQVSIEQQIAAAQAEQVRLEEERSKKRREFTGADIGLKAGVRTIDKDQQAELDKLTENIQTQRKTVLELETSLNVARQKNANEVTAGQLDAEEARVNAVKGSSDKVVKVSEDEAAKRLAIQQQVQDILNKGENEIFLASLSEREKRNAQLAQEFDDRVAQIREAFDKLRKLAGEDPAKLAAIQQAEGEAITESIRQQEAEALKLKQDFDAEDIELAKKTAKELLDIEQKAADERRKLAEEQAQLQRENIEELSNFIDGAISLLARRNEEERKAAEERLAGINDDFAAQLSANEAFDQSEQNRARKRQAILAEQASAIAAERDRIAEEDKQAREVRSKEFINFLLDELEKIVLINAAKIQAFLAGDGAKFGPIGVAAGLAQGAIFALLIKALFAGVKAAVLGAYTGEELVGANGEKPVWSGRDGYLRRVHKNEGIVDAATNVKYLPIINAMRGGNFEKYIEQQFAMRRANEYLGSDDGRRMAISVMPAKFQDKNMVGEMKLTRAEQKRTNELLAALLVQRTTHNRRWNAA